MLAVVAACNGRDRAAPDTASASAARVQPESTRAAGAPEGATGRRTILFVGTSLTAGLGLDPDEAYPSLIARRIDSLGESYQVVNAGVSGETSADAVRRMPWLLRQPVDVLVLETGANDGLRGLSVDSMRSNIERIIDDVRAAHPQVQVILVGMEAPPNLGPAYASQFRATFPTIAREKHTLLVPFLLKGVAAVDTLNQADGIHPNERGEKMVEENVWQVLGPLVTSK